MELKINGEIQSVDADIKTVTQLLNTRNIELKCVAVELNGEILEPNQFDSTALKENDVIEIVSFVGGG
jgi:sulfur carrier protein